MKNLIDIDAGETYVSQRDFHFIVSNYDNYFNFHVTNPTLLFINY